MYKAGDRYGRVHRTGNAKIVRIEFVFCVMRIEQRARGLAKPLTLELSIVNTKLLLVKMTGL